MKTIIYILLIMAVCLGCNDTAKREQLKNDSIKKAQADVFWIQKHKEDSVSAIEIRKRDSLSRIKFEAEEKAFEKTKAGKIHKKHPEWTKDECEAIANRQIWIGMTIDMVKYMRGLPNSANPSNYGNGTEWQWCWWDYSPSCFYGGEDGIITSYN